ncbi:MAG: glycosyltransferase family 1 protein [Patescibacteria group bacterium]
MHIWIDGRAACSASRTGKGQWVLRTVAALLKRTTVTILTDGSAVPELWQNGNATIRSLPKGIRWHTDARRLIIRSNPDVYIAPSSFIVPALLPRSIRCVPIIHDLIAFQSDPHEWKAKLIERLTLKKALKKAAHVCTISMSTKKDLLARFPFVDPDRISVIFAGPLDEHPAQSSPDGETILCPGTLCPRKNQLRLIQAYAGLPQGTRDQYRLLLVGGRGWQDAEIVRLAQETPGVEWRGYVPEEEYRTLLARCTVLAFPSLYEGFGLPVLDALQRGIPVLTSAGGSLPEVTGGYAVTVEPRSVESIRMGLLHILQDATLQETLRTAGPGQAQQFSWDRTAELLLQAV